MSTKVGNVVNPVLPLVTETRIIGTCLIDGETFFQEELRGQKCKPQVRWHCRSFMGKIPVMIQKEVAWTKVHLEKIVLAIKESGTLPCQGNECIPLHVGEMEYKFYYKEGQNGRLGHCFLCSQ